MKEIAAFVAVAIFSLALCEESDGGHALFVKTSSSDDAHSRVRRAAPATAADVLAQNILEWIQGIYHQGARKPRQQSDPPGYLPPYSTRRPPERPRPFQPPTTANYPYQRPTTGFPSPSVDASAGAEASSIQPPPFSTQRSTYLPPSGQSTYRPSSYNPRPSSTPSYSNTGSTTFPSFSTTSRPAPSTSSSQSGYSTSSSATTNYGYSSNTGKFSTPGGFTPDYEYSSQRPGSSYVPSPSTNGYTQPTAGAGSYEQNVVTGGYPSSSSYPSQTPDRGFPAQETSSISSGSGVVGPTETGGGGANILPTGQGSSVSGVVTTGGANVDEDLKHPPHIHALDVQCSKTMMTINIEFNRVFDGIIYSKGYFMNPECRYVAQNSGQSKYSFTVNLDSCGTQFINDFAGDAGQAYLENVLVLQNEPGIQEVWDTVRRVRCLWEGNINKALSVNLSVDMLNQEIVTFSGDTAVARLDIQVGRGPFAPAADGLVKIGETMTLVVSVEGDPAFDLQVRDCIARDGTTSNVIHLTDDRGCILKPKLFGAFQKTTDTGNTGASVIAYAYFQAFKFPDVMDLFIECNVELCKTDCEPCPAGNQQIEPGRRRRSISNVFSNKPMNGSAVLLADPIRVTRGFRVVMVDDLSKASSHALEQLEETAVEQVTREAMNVCMTYSGFYIASSLILSTVLLTTLTTLLLYFKLQRVYRLKHDSS